jgi:hypothetical protein
MLRDLSLRMDTVASDHYPTGINQSTHQYISTSAHQHINTSAHQLICQLT